MKGSAEGAARKVRKATKSRGRVEVGEGGGFGWGGEKRQTTVIEQQ